MKQVKGLTLKNICISPVSLFFLLTGAKKCMKQLGCFEITPDFYDLRNRPVNFLPHDRVLIDTKFKLYTKRHPMEEDYLDANDHDDLKESSFDPKHKTIFIVHGFFDSTLYGKWMEVSFLDII